MDYSVVLAVYVGEHGRAFSRIHPGRCIGFIEEEAKTVDTTPKRLHDTNTTPRGQQYNPHQPSDKTRLASTPAKNGKEGIHRASRPRHNLS
jgi:hypothetical protein